MRAEFYQELTRTEKEIILTFNVERFKKYFEKIWPKRGWTDGEILSDKVYAILLRVFVLGMPDAPGLKKATALKWLYDKGYGTEDLIK